MQMADALRILIEKNAGKVGRHPDQVSSFRQKYKGSPEDAAWHPGSIPINTRDPRWGIG